MKEGEIMDGTEVAVKLEAHEHEIDSLKHRIKDLEVQNKTIQENAISTGTGGIFSGSLDRCR